MPLASSMNILMTIKLQFLYNFGLQIVCRLLSRGILEEDIGIITPYNSQVDLIRQAVSTSVEIHTIDKYQVIFMLM